jgi:hypothetical protein
MIAVAADANQTVTEMVVLPLRQLDEPPQQGDMGAYMSWWEFKRSIAVDDKPVHWETTTLASKSSLDCTWDFWSVWAAPETIRTGKGFRVIHMGPVISCKTSTGSRAYVATAALQAEEGSGGRTWRQTSLRWEELTPSLSEGLLRATPECPSLSLFAKTVVKTWAAPSNTREPQ